MISGDMQGPGVGPGDDGFDADGYDESQRAEILEATRSGPGDGTILTDLAPDLAAGTDDEDEDAPIGDLDATLAAAGPDDEDGDLDDDDDDDDDDEDDDDFDDDDDDDDDLDDDELDEDALSDADESTPQP